MMYRKVCKQCGKVFESEDYSEIVDLLSCDDCHVSLSKIEEIGTAEDSWQDALDGSTEEKESHAPEFELFWNGTNKVETLPNAAEGGYVGRLGSLEAVIDRPTISRLQFAYRLAEDGHGLLITNQSMFGTWVNGQLLQKDESAIATAGSTIEMGGFTFELHERIR